MKAFLLPPKAVNGRDHNNLKWRIIGTICVEECPGVRSWTPGEQASAGRGHAT